MEFRIPPIPLDPMATHLKVKEKEIQSAILEYLAIRGHVCKRNQSGMLFKDGNAIRMGEAGWPDIIGCTNHTETLSAGRFFGIEVKTGYNKPTEAQLRILNNIKENGGLSLVAYSVDDVIKCGL